MSKQPSKQRTKKPAKRAAKVPVGRMWVYGSDKITDGESVLHLWTGKAMVIGFRDGTEWTECKDTPEKLDKCKVIRRVKGTP